VEPLEGAGRVEPVEPKTNAVTTVRGRQKTMVGRVSSNKMEKTIVVQVEKVKRHMLYHRNLRHLVSYKVHDESNACAIGDVVKIIETRPISKEKCWRVLDVIKRGDDLGTI